MPRGSCARGLGGYEGELLFAEHHESHAASTFFSSPFEEAAILTIDGVGEWATAAIGVGHGSEIELLKELHWPDSLGHPLYYAFTYYTGFKESTSWRRHRFSGSLVRSSEPSSDLLNEGPKRQSSKLAWYNRM